MDPMTAALTPEPRSDAREPVDEPRETGLLDSIDVAPRSTEVLLSSGRRYRMSAEGDADRLTIHARNGRLVLCVIVTTDGPVLAFEGAELEVRATRSLVLEADRVELRAKTLQTEVETDVNERIGGERHTRIGRADRLEAASIQTQASDGPIELRAAGRVAVDGEHIGLNDDPCPEPFAWSELARKHAGVEVTR